MYKCINGWTKAKMLKVLKARKHQGKSMRDGYPECAYKASDGNMCGVGMFIPKKEYEYGMEGHAVGSLMKLYPSLKEQFPLSPDGMSGLQVAHDCSYHAKEMMISWVKENVKE